MTGRLPGRAMTGERALASETGVLVIAADSGLNGQVRNCRRLEIHGRLEGEVETTELIVHAGGICTGRVRAEQAEVMGTLEGEVRVRRAIRIRSSGAVAGNVLYGSLALEPGGELSATVRNVPPTVGGDFQIEVAAGGSVRLTLSDLTAHDPDDRPEDLRFAVSRVVAGRVAHTTAPDRALEAFTQADLTAGQVLFVHDGGTQREGGFEVVVSDAKGATSGAPRRVRALVL